MCPQCVIHYLTRKKNNVDSIHRKIFLDVIINFNNMIKVVNNNCVPRLKSFSGGLGVMLCMLFCQITNACSSSNDSSDIIGDEIKVTHSKKLIAMNIPEEKIYTQIYYDKSDRISQLTINYKNVASVDYDQHIISYQKNNIVYNCNFKTNTQGYISEIGGYKCSYDSNGFLTNVERTSGLWTFQYVNDDLKTLIYDNLVRDRPLNYIFSCLGDNHNVTYYVEMPHRLFFTDFKTKKRTNTEEVLTEAMIVAAAYYSGLFGNVVKHFRYLSESEESVANFEQINYEDDNFIVFLNFE